MLRFEYKLSLFGSIVEGSHRLVFYGVVPFYDKPIAWAFFDSTHVLNVPLTQPAYKGGYLVLTIYHPILGEGKVGHFTYHEGEPYPEYYSPGVSGFQDFLWMQFSLTRIRTQTRPILYPLRTFHHLS